MSQGEHLATAWLLWIVSCSVMRFYTLSESTVAVDSASAAAAMFLITRVIDDRGMSGAVVMLAHFKQVFLAA
jgi:hypothetical protein